MRSLILSAHPLPNTESLVPTAFLNTHALRKHIHTRFRTGTDTLVSPPSKSWAYSASGHKTLTHLLETAKARRYAVSWLHPKGKTRFNLPCTTTLPTRPATQSQYTKIVTAKILVFVGDIHGHLSALKALLRPWLTQDAYFVFTGDYVSKGPESAGTLVWITQTFLHKNRGLLLTGNHDLHLEDWTHHYAVKKDDFLQTWPGIHSAPKRPFLRTFLTQMHDAAILHHQDNTYYVSHGGVVQPDAFQNPTRAADFIYGFGTPDTDIDSLWAAAVANPHHIQVHGHRNAAQRPIQAASNSWNLEGVDTEQTIRAVAITPAGPRFLSQPCVP